MNITKSHAAPAMRRERKPNPWTRPIELQFNAAEGMLFRTCSRLGFPRPQMAKPSFQARSGRKMELFPAIAAQQGSE
jgi:hypothetical protein